MIILNSSLEDLEDRIDRYNESADSYPQKIAIENGICDDNVIIAVEPGWRVAEKDLIAVEGECWCRNEDTCQYEMDWACTLLYANTSDDEFDPEDWIYLEQGSPTSAIHNYLRAVGKDGQTI